MLSLQATVYGSFGSRIVTSVYIHRLNDAHTNTIIISTRIMFSNIRFRDEGKLSLASFGLKLLVWDAISAAERSRSDGLKPCRLFCTVG